MKSASLFKKKVGIIVNRKRKTIFLIGYCNYVVNDFDIVRSNIILVVFLLKSLIFESVSRLFDIID